MRLPAPIPDANESPIDASDVMKERSEGSVGSALSRICSALNPRFERSVEKVGNETVNVTSKAIAVEIKNDKYILIDNIEIDLASEI